MWSISSRKMMNVIAWLNRFFRILQYLFVGVFKIIRALRSKRYSPPVKSEPELVAAKKRAMAATHHHPNKNKKTFTSNKIIWAYWHSGQDALPGFCRLCLQSWRVRNPDWEIIVLDESSYQDYVCTDTDLPSTFGSLRVQHKSDVIRLAVLRRYGGLYMDASYLCFRCFDDMWDHARANHNIYLTSLATMTGSCSNNMVLPNNCFLMVPRSQNPVIVSWQKTALAYLEIPSLSVHEIGRHPVLSHLGDHHFEDQSLGVFASLAPYLGVVWCLAQTLYFDKEVADYVKEHAWFLPPFRWTLDFMMVELQWMTEKEANTRVSGNETWSAWLFRRFPGALELTFKYKPEMAARITQMTQAFKCSSDFCFGFHKPPEFHIRQESTLGLIYRAAIDTSLIAQEEQATVEGAYRITPVV